MKKAILFSVLLLVGTVLFAQNKASDQKSAPKDSITAQDIAKIRYVLSAIIMQYNQECYNDSIPVTAFYDKPVGGQWWKTIGQYYWDIYTPLPNVKYLHRKMDIGVLLEQFQSKLGGQ